MFSPRSADPIRSERQSATRPALHTRAPRAADPDVLKGIDQLIESGHPRLRDAPDHGGVAGSRGGDTLRWARKSREKGPPSAARWLASPTGYLLGSYRIATALESNSSRLTSFKSAWVDSPPTTSVRGARAWDAPRTRTRRSIPALSLSAVAELTHRMGIGPAGVLGVHKVFKLAGTVQTHMVAPAAPSSNRGWAAGGRDQPEGKPIGYGMD